MRLIFLVASLLIGIIHVKCESEDTNLFHCPEGWKLREQNCYRFFNIRHSWQEAAGFCERYGANLAMVEDDSENVFVQEQLARMYLDSSQNKDFWIGLMTLNELTTNTLESASGHHISLYAGLWSKGQPNVEAGECVKASVNESSSSQSWKLNTCEQLLPFMCKSKACSRGSKLCANGRCLNEAFFCDGDNDCGDMSDEIDCPNSCKYYMTSSTDSLESPTYPNKYNGSSLCKWTLEGPVGHNIILQFNDFETENNFDTVQILTGGRTEESSMPLVTLSGLQESNLIYETASNFLIVKFQTDGSVEKRGFRASWKTEPQECGGEIVAGTQPKELISKNYPKNIPGGMECLYVIRSQPGRIVTLDIEDFDLETDKDYILIRDGPLPTSPELAYLTGSKEENPHHVISTGSSMYLYIHTNLGDTRKGYKINYYSGCSVEMKAAEGNLTSPAYGIADYPNNQECDYVIRNPNGRRLSIKFADFQVDEKDRLLAYDGEDMSTAVRLHPGDGFSGGNPPRITLTSDSGAMRLRFITDPLRSDFGWSAVFSADCPPLKVGKGVIRSSVETSFGSAINFTCPIGQEFTTNKDRITTTCMMGGKWSVEYIPDCQEVYCGPVPQIDNGFSIGATNVTYLGQATYQCYAGFGFPSGNPVETITCTVQGRWQALPECMASQCPTLPEVPNASMETLNGHGQNYGTVVRILCNEGYVRSGFPVLHCMTNGSWSGSVPSCSKVQCRDFPEIENGFIEDTSRNYFYEDDGRVQCHRGYRLIGSPIIRCGPDRSFIDLPQCQDMDECGTTQCDSGSTECENTPGAFFCGCKSGYEPNLDCRPMGDLGISDGGIADDAIETSSNAEGYEKRGLRLNSQIGWCGGDIGPNRNHITVDLKVPTVIHGLRIQPVRHSDGALAFPSSIRLQYSNDISDVFREYSDDNNTAIEFRIAVAASLHGINLPKLIEARYIRLVIAEYQVAPCLMFELMGCSRQSCTDINECMKNNGGCSHKCNNFLGTYSCSCEEGFELYAKNATAMFYIQDGETGMRDGDTYRLNKTCVPKMCPKLTAPVNGVILDTRNIHHYGDIVAFTCKFGYVMEGPEFLTCQSTGEWNGTIPSCIPATCESLPEDPDQGLSLMPNKLERVNFMGNVTINCMDEGMPLRETATAGFRECVYDLYESTGVYWLAGEFPSCPRVDCDVPAETPGAIYSFTSDTKYGAGFYFGCEDTFRLAGQSSANDNLVRCMKDGNWDFGDLRCEGPVCSDPGYPADGTQIASSYEQGSKVSFECIKEGYIPITSEPIKCIREPECKIVKPLGITSGKIPSSAINATSERANYESKHIRINSATGWCGMGVEGISFVTVDLEQVHRIKAILVKGVITNDVVGRPTEIRLFYKVGVHDKYTVYFPNFNLTAREPGNYGELAMITLPTTIRARFVLLSIISFDKNPCLKLELMGCEDNPPSERLLGFNTGFPFCVDNSPPQFTDCPNGPILVLKGPDGLLPVNFSTPHAYDNAGRIARMEVRPAGFQPPVHVFDDMLVEYLAFDFDGNVAICQINITVPDNNPPMVRCPKSYVFSLVEQRDNYTVNFNTTLSSIIVEDDIEVASVKIMPDIATIRVGGYENVSVIATDTAGNTASCSFQVGVQAAVCTDWSLKTQKHGSLSCLTNNQGIMECTAACDSGYRFTDNEPTKTFICTPETNWVPTQMVPDCVSVDTQEASYDVTAGVLYRSNGAVQPSCLPQYKKEVARFYEELNDALTKKCSGAVSLDISVTFQDAMVTMQSDNMIKIEYIMRIASDIKNSRTKDLYNLCSNTLSFVYDLGVPSASFAIKSLLNVASTGSNCPAMRALNSTFEDGYTCGMGEILSSENSNGVPTCLHCPAGTFARRGATACSPCEKGYYQDLTRQGMCKKCPSGTYTISEGSKSGMECIPVCGYGTYSLTGLVPCLNCPQNSYTGEPNESGFTECESCPPQTYTYREAASSQEFCRQLCSPGTYSDTGLEPCYPCPVNYFQPELGATTCIECPTSNQTFETGSMRSSDCRPVACTDSICKNGGLCLARQHQIQCYCPAGFTGRFCEVDINECESDPCYNGGTCLDEPQSYRCECPEKYSGLQCQDEEGDCVPDACPERAMCKDNPGVGNFECLCRSGYTGPNCNVTLNPCEDLEIQCVNGALCIPLQQGRFQCQCAPGWTGRLCDINIDDCAENPCLLNSKCTDMVNDFSCDCPEGFSGKRCQTKVDLCGDSPCMHGVCVDHFFSNECICEKGWDGVSCDVNINECEQNPCQNGGECIDEVGEYKCSCAIGYTGKMCQHEIDDCASNPCLNGGTCTDEIDGFSCECRPGFLGFRCDVATDECQTNPCDPVGTVQCLDLDNMFKCQCHPGFSGEFCEVNINECMHEPCLNSGTCIDQVNDYMCACMPGWTGKMCENDIGGCASNPCLNDAECIDLFEDYFCVCPSGTDGKRCQVAPDRCVGDPCMHGAMCQDYGSGLNCSCSMDYTGIGCQYEFDACDEGVCQNGATCMDNGPGYTCKCPLGYTGRFCEEDIIDCLPSSCAPGATCIDLTNDFYCKCPFNLTGDDCRKVINVDYELYFNDELKDSSAALATPFTFGSSNSFTLALWVQFSMESDPGAFITMYEVSSPHVPSDKKLLLQATDAGVSISFGEERQFVSFRSNIPMNDGQWHHLAIVWNGAESTLTLTTDAVVVAHIESFASNFMVPMNGWIKLGATHRHEFEAYNGGGFFGRIARVNVWDRPLDFRMEIPKMVRSCMKSPVVFNGLILRWNGYDDATGNVERISPSTCGEYICPPGFVGDCTKLKVDKVPPRFDHCPGDVFITAPNGTTIVEWNEPMATDNIGLTRVEEKSGFSSGRPFTPGTYRIAYVAYDDAGNSAECSFNIYVVEDDVICSEPTPPENGKQTCNRWGPGGIFRHCTIECNEGLQFSTQVPDFYTCGPEGKYRPSTNDEQLIYPSCSPSTPAQRLFKIKMQFPTSVICNSAGENVLKEKIRLALNKLNREWNLCTETDQTSGECIDLNVLVGCASRKRITRSVLLEAPSRVKRQSADGPDEVYEVEIVFPSQNDPISNLGGNFESTVKELIEKIILEDNSFDVRSELPSVIPDPSTLELVSEYSCPIGKVVMGSNCVDCATGSYYDVEKKMCELCDFGTYQNELGQIQCKSCPAKNGQPGVTQMKGSTDETECKEKCAAGRKYNIQANLCQPCGYGFYQSMAGSFSCIRCELGKTTQTPEAVSADECRDECDSGYQRIAAGTCEMCPEGTYRTKGIDASCMSCPSRTTTEGKGALSIQECNIPICSEGTYFDMEGGDCKQCPEGTYQPETKQKSCLECPSGTWTSRKASTSDKDCLNACVAQGDDLQCDAFADCIEIPDKKFKCQCKNGYIGNGTYCMDSCKDVCKNDGICHKEDNGTPYCECEGSFTGKFCESKSNFAYLASGIAGVVVFIILLVLIIWMICIRSTKKKEAKKLLPPTSTDPNGSQVNFFYGPAAPYAESIAPSHHSTYAHYYDDEEDAWEMPNFYNETYMKAAYANNATNSLARSNASLYGNKEDLYDRLRKHAYQGKKEKDETMDSDDQGRL